MQLLCSWILSIVLALFKTTLRRLDSVSFRWNVLSWAQSTELVRISGHQHQVQVLVQVILRPMVSRPVRLGVGHTSTEVEVEVTLRPTVSRPISLGVRRPSVTRDQFYFFLAIFFRPLRFWNFVAPSLTRGWVCNLLYNCFWALPEQSLLGRSSAELTAIFYCLIWDSPNLEGQVPVFISPRNRVAQLYPWKPPELELEFVLRPTVSRPVSLGIGPPFGTLDQILSLLFFRLTITSFCFQCVLSDEKTGL
jgi:hypothetical protein